MQLVIVVTYSDMWDVCIGMAMGGQILILSTCFLVHVIFFFFCACYFDV